MKGKGKINLEKLVNLLLNILVLVFAVILLISIYIGVQTKILKKNYADFFGYSIFEVQTGSMEEAISPGDWIIVKLTKNVKLNNIITYEYKGEYITHRIIEVYNGTYITKGDANTAKDDPVDQHQVVGKVAKILPGFGLLRKTIFNPVVIIALIVTLFLFNIALKKQNEFNFNKIIDFFKSRNSEFKIRVKKLISEFRKEKIKPTNSEVIKVDVIENEIQDNDLEAAREEINAPVEEENELDKTIFFRVVSVDSSEIDDTLLEAAESKMNSNEKIINKNISKKEIVKEEKKEQEKKLNIIKNTKKTNNLIESVMFLKEEELNEIMNLFIEEIKNGISIKNDFIKLYIKSKYYNLNEDRSTNIKLVMKNLKTNLKNKANDLFKQKPKNRAVINDCLLTLNLIASLEQAKETIEDVQVRDEFYKKEIMKYSNNWDDDFSEEMVSKINNIQDKYYGFLKELLEKLDTSVFELKCESLTNHKNIYGVKLDHNLSFSKVYSDYIIDKTYSEGIVAEDKILVLISLLSRKLINDMINYQFGNKYLLYIPGSLYGKEKKIASILKIIDNDYIKSNVYITVTFEELINNKKTIKEIRKKGYGFALVIDKEYKITSKDSGYIYFADYIFVNKAEVNIDNITPYIPKDLLKIVECENVEERLGIKGD